MTEDEIIGWYHQPNGHEIRQTLGVGVDSEAWHGAVHGVAKSWTRLSDFTLTFNQTDHMGHKLV